MSNCVLTTPIISVSGDCLNSNSGEFIIDWAGSTGSVFTITPINPVGSPIVTSSFTYSQTNLSAGTYSYTITDNCLPTNNSVTVNVYISSGTCISLNEFGTTCGLNDGSITATTSNLYNQASFSLYDINDTFYFSGNSFTNQYVFNNLSPGTYYVTGEDGGGCTGRSESCIIVSSQTLDFGFYVIDNGSCSPPTPQGKIFITGLTGTPPYTYLWSPGGQTTSSITGLTSGPYNVTITDGIGCVTNKGINVNTVPALGIGALIVTPPSCFSADGQVQVTITGGTAPYFYQGSNGTTQVSFSSTYTFTGLTSGIFTVTITDAGLCSATQSTTLSIPAGFNVTSVNIINSNCSNNDGRIDIQLFGGTGPYTYQLTSGSTVYNTVSASQNFTFYPLSPGTYSLLISAGTCVYTNTYTVNNTSLFDLSGITTGTTCGLSNGSIEVNISGGSGVYDYIVSTAPSNPNQYQNYVAGYSFSSFTETNLPCGPYIITVSDILSIPPCVQYIPLNIPCSNGVNFNLVGTNSYLGSTGTATAYITSGTPPFTLNWSPNVNGQTGSTVTNLSAGTYSLTITDSIGCVETRTVIISGFNLISSYETLTICDDSFTNSNLVVQKGPRQMLLEGFSDLTSGDTGCTLNYSTFEAIVSVDGVSASTIFYTGYTLNDYPTINVWVDTIKEMLLEFDGIDAVNSDILNNSIQIVNGCKNPISLDDKTVTTDLKIHYDISCVYCS